MIAERGCVQKGLLSPDEESSGEAYPQDVCTFYATQQNFLNDRGLAMKRGQLLALPQREDTHISMKSSHSDF